VARALTHYASRHPKLGIKFFMIPQVEGTLPRSHAVEGVTEGLLKRYGNSAGDPVADATAVVFVAYMGHGRFDVPREAPVLDLRQPDFELAEAAVAAVNGHELPEHELPEAGQEVGAPPEDVLTPSTTEETRVPLGLELPSLVTLPPSPQPAPGLPLSSQLSSPATGGLGDSTANE